MIDLKTLLDMVSNHMYGGPTPAFLDTYEKRLQMFAQTYPNISPKSFKRVGIASISYDRRFYRDDDSLAITMRPPTSLRDRFTFEFHMRAEQVYPWGYRRDGLTKLISTGWPFLPGMNIHFGRNGYLVATDQERVIAITDWGFPGDLFETDWRQIESTINAVNTIPVAEL